METSRHGDFANAAIKLSAESSCERAHFDVLLVVKQWNPDKPGAMHFKSYDRPYVIVNNIEFVESYTVKVVARCQQMVYAEYDLQVDLIGEEVTRRYKYT